MHSSRGMCASESDHQRLIHLCVTLSLEASSLFALLSPFILGKPLFFTYIDGWLARPLTRPPRDRRYSPYLNPLKQFNLGALFDFYITSPRMSLERGFEKVSREPC
jgi:hypothetical protein